MGTPAYLRFQLRTRFQQIHEDDGFIDGEGIASLSILELQQACSQVKHKIKYALRTLIYSSYSEAFQLLEFRRMCSSKSLNNGSVLYLLP